MDEWFWTFLLSCGTIIITIYMFVKWKLSYWERRSIEYRKPTLFSNKMGKIVRETYLLIKSKGVKHGGCFMFFTPFYVPVDLEILKCIMQKDFDHFVDRTIIENEKIDPLTGGLIALRGNKWRDLRQKLTPTFTSGKIKMMFQTMVDTTPGLLKLIDKFAETHQPANAKLLMSRYTMDVIGSCAFGMDCNALEEFQTNKFKTLSTIAVKDINRKLLLNFLLPRKIIRKFKLTYKYLEDFFFDLVDSTITYRETNNIYRKDFMHLLLQLRNKGEVDDGDTLFDNDIQKTGTYLGKSEIAAQCFVFFAAGFNTTATTISAALLELSVRLDLQEKLREEMRRTLKKNGGNMTYDAIMEMEYLDKVVNESLRLHGPVEFMFRTCTKDYKVPGTDLTINEGDNIFLPFDCIHKDADYYPDPEQFDPERFSPENKAKRPTFSFLPFGEGPRMCIGMRFGLVEIKVGLTAILTNFQVSLNKKTKLPLQNDAFGLITEKEIWLDFKKL